MGFLNIWLPITNLEFSIVLLFVIGFCIGVLGGFFGVGGGWIATPALNIFRFDMDFAVGTDITQIFGNSIIATKVHSGMGNIDWKLGIFSIIFSVFGVELSAQLVVYLKAQFGAETLDMIIRWCYIVLLGVLGIFMLYDYFVVQKRMAEEDQKNFDPSLKKTTSKAKKKPKKAISLPQRLQLLKIPPMVSFPISGIKSVSVWIVLLIFFIAGALQGFLGVGGGFIKMPAMIYLLGVPTIIAVGTDLFNVLITSLYGGFTYALKGRVEIIAALIMFCGGAIGAAFGSTATKYVHGYRIRLLFAIMILIAGFSVLVKQLEKPLEMPVLNTISGVLVLGGAIGMTSIVLGKLLVSYLKVKKSELTFNYNDFEKK